MNPYINNDRPRFEGLQGLLAKSGQPYPGSFPVVIDPRGLLIPDPHRSLPICIDQPSRRIPRKRRSVAGAVPFRSLGRLVRFESSLEGNVLDVLKVCQPYVGVVEQPLRLSKKKLGYGTGFYTPDFLIWIWRGPNIPWEVTLVEVKYEDQLREDWQVIKPKLLAGLRFAKRQGWRFLLLTERHLRREPAQQGEWPRIHTIKYDLADPVDLLSRLFRVKVP